MKLYIDTVNGHRAGEIIATALRIGFSKLHNVEVVYDRPSATHAILYATLVNNKKAAVNIDMAKNIPTLLLHDDLDIPSSHDGMTTISAFTGIQFMRSMYFHPLYQSRLAGRRKLYDFVYGGTYKPQREYMYKAKIPNKPSTLLIGDDERWDAIAPKATRLKTIRDMYALYDLMSVCKDTFTDCDNDELAAGHKLPLRAIEPYMCGMTDNAPISSIEAYRTIKQLLEVLKNAN